VLLLAAALLVVVLLAAGCGLQTEEANKQLARATGQQENAEAILVRVKAFPAEWEALFNVGKVGPDQVNVARQLLQAREADLDALDKALGAWEEDLRAIAKLNVEQAVKDYVSLKVNAVRCWQDYVTTYLRPLIASYGGMVEIIAYGRPLSEQSAKAQEITNLVSEAAQGLEECRAAEKKADDYFRENKLGK
jgi:hypothetical protein